MASRKFIQCFNLDAGASILPFKDQQSISGNLLSSKIIQIDTYNKRQGGYDVTTSLTRRISGTTIARRTKFGHGLLHI